MYYRCPNKDAIPRRISQGFAAAVYIRKHSFLARPREIPLTRAATGIPMHIIFIVVSTTRDLLALIVLKSFGNFFSRKALHLSPFFLAVPE